MKRTRRQCLSSQSEENKLLAAVRMVLKGECRSQTAAESLNVSATKVQQFFEAATNNKWSEEELKINVFNSTTHQEGDMPNEVLIEIKAEEEPEVFQMCRGCRKDESHNLFSIHENGLKEMFLELTGIEVKDEDPAPKMLCSFCRSQLFNFSEFRETCIDSNRFFNERIRNVKINQDMDETEIEKIFVDSIKFEGDKTEVHLESPSVASKSKRKDPIERYSEMRESSNVRLTCRFCGKSYKTLISRQEHERVVHLEEEVTCDLCSKVYGNKYKLNRHQSRSHHIRKSDQPEIPTSFELLPDTQNVDKKEEVPAFTTKRKRIVRRSFLSSRRFPCRFCEKSFRKKSFRNHHENCVHVVEEVTCDLCSKVYGNKYKLYMHMLRFHLRRTRNKPETPISFKPVPDIQDVDEKEICVDPIKPMPQEMQTEIPTLTIKHQRKRIVRKFPCEICGVSFTSRFLLQAHDNCVHLEEEATCELCSSVYQNKKKLYMHMLRFHKMRKSQQIETLTSLEPIPNKQNLDEKEICVDPIKPMSEEMQTEIPTHNTNRKRERIVKRSLLSSGRFPCRFCENSYKTLFSRRHHEKTVHLEEEASCNLCSKVFGNRYKLNWHMRRFHHIRTRNQPETPISFEPVPDTQDVDEKEILVYPFKPMSEEMQTEIPTLDTKHQRKRIVRKFPCEICGVSFTTRFLLQAHDNCVHLEEEATCELCSSVYQNKTKLYMHMLRFHKMRKSQQIETLTSLEPIPNKQNLDEKEICVDPIKTMPEEIPEKSSSVPLISSEEEYPFFSNKSGGFPCEICGLTFPTRFDLGRHEKAVHVVEEVTCDLCSKVYGNKSKLYTHMLRFHHVRKNQQNETLASFERVSDTEEVVEKEICADPIKSMPEEIQEESSPVPLISSEKENPSSSNKNEGFPCAFCKKLFKSRLYRKRHERFVHEQEEVICPYCSTSKIYGNKKRLYDHITRFHIRGQDPNKFPLVYQKKPYDFQEPKKPQTLHPCRVCKKVFTCSTSRYNHERQTHSKEERLTCEYCSKTLENKIKLYFHIKRMHLRGKEMRSHNPTTSLPVHDIFPNFTKINEPYQVPSNTLERLTQTEQRKRAKLSEPVIDRLFCNECGKSINRTYFIEHWRYTHQIDEHPSTCDECKQEFSNIFLFEEHQRMVHGILKCFKCGNRRETVYSRDPKDVNAFLFHLKKCIRDPNDKPFECKSCSKRFVTHRNLSVHETKCKGTTILCHLCSKELTVKGYYQHMNYHKTGVFPCRYCGKVFPNNNSRNTHERGTCQKDEVICAYCSKKFANKARLRRHINSVHLKKKIKQKLHTCPICSKSYTHLPTHLLSHSDERNHHCQYPGCGMSFINKRTLTRHKHVHEKTRPYNCRMCSTGYYQIEYLRGHYKRDHGQVYQKGFLLPK